MADAALHAVLDHRLALERRLEADHWSNIGRGCARIAVAPAPVIEACTTLGARFLAHLSQLLQCAVAAIGKARVKQTGRDLGVALGTGSLVHRLAIPIEFKPAQTVKNGFHRRFGRARAVSILDAQQEAAAMMARKEPVEQGCPRPAYMQKAGG